MGYIDGFILGSFGGALGEFIKWYNIRNEISRTGVPDWSKSYLYWVITVVMMLLGGCMVMVYMKSSAVLNAFLAVHIGASTPLIISGITRETPSISIGNID